MDRRELCAVQNNQAGTMYFVPFGSEEQCQQVREQTFAWMAARISEGCTQRSYKLQYRALRFQEKRHLIWYDLTDGEAFCPTWMWRASDVFDSLCRVDDCMAQLHVRWAQYET